MLSGLNMLRISSGEVFMRQRIAFSPWAWTALLAEKYTFSQVAGRPAGNPIAHVFEFFFSISSDTETDQEEIESA
jgi:hypothetical protein